MRRDRLSLKEALERIHFSSVARVKKGSGMLGVLTENAIPESTFVKQAVYGAVIHLLHCGLALPPKRTGR
jgi:non-canonical (house-cleaning) NTP pyrophosphatase